ncbi:MAG: ATPase [Gelidibacter sp.]|nr:ATPase [Gelidibacter sp.]
MITEPHIKIEGTSKFQIGELKNDIVHYDFEKIKTYLNIKGYLLFGSTFKLYPEDDLLLYKLCCYFIQDHYSCSQMGIDTNKGLLLSGPVGCGKTSLMKLLPHLAPHKTNYEIIPTRNIVFNFNATGFEVLDRYNETRNYCFDDLGIEPTGCHYTKECNVMGEILLSRHDLYINSKNLVAERGRSKTHITTNLNAEELEQRYGNRVRSRLREMLNVIAFDSKDKRQ